MSLSDFTVRVILLFIPGIIAFLIIERLTIHKETKVHRLMIYSLLLGFLCYSFYSIIMIVIKWDINYRCDFFSTLENPDNSLNFNEIIMVSVLSIFVGYIFAYLINYKVLHKIAHKIKASKKFGDIDVWSYIMNSNIEEVEWVTVRDIENDLLYEGWVKAFSDGIERDELFLRYVMVFRNSTGKKLYETPAVYLPRKKENLVIEFPKLSMNGYNVRKRVKEEK